MSYYVKFDSEDINSTIAFDLIRNIVYFKKYALIDDESNILETFNTEEQAKRVQNNSRYSNSTLIELNMPNETILNCIKSNFFTDADSVINFITGGYLQSAEYQLNELKKELLKSDVDTSLLSLIEYKQYKQELNKKILAEYLENNPILWTDGKYYGVSQEDQIEMQSDLTAYTLKQNSGHTDWKLEWHDKQKACREFTLEEFHSLLNAIIDYVYPLRRKQETYKEQIYAAKSHSELDNLVITYDQELTDDTVIE